MNRNQISSTKHSTGKRSVLDRKMAAYLAAVASGSLLAKEVGAVVVSNSSIVPFGINGVVNIDFNGDGQTDFQIDHDRVDLGGMNFVDYLQIDKNDINGENNPLDFDPLTGFQAATFPPGSTTPNDANNAAHFIQNPANSGANLEYPAALLPGAEIGPTSNFDFQEGENVYGSEKTGHMNRLIDEDHGQIDMILGGKTADQIVTPTNTPQFLGVQNQVRYLGLRMDLNNASANDTPDQFNYGWIGIKITNETDATGEVVGYGYETDLGVSILAGETGALLGDFNFDAKVDAADYVVWRKTNSASGAAYTEWRTHFGEPAVDASDFLALSRGNQGVPEPSSLLLTITGGIMLLGTFFLRRIRRSSPSPMRVGGAVSSWSQAN